MLDLGQPNHTFDAKRLDKGSGEGGIVVRDARDGESITTLDGEERKLCGDDLLICAGDEPVALAGIMGGEGSKVGEDTSQLLLEVATFVPTTIRRTSTRVGLRTDSSARFEKHLDPTLPMAAAGPLRAAAAGAPAGGPLPRAHLRRRRVDRPRPQHHPAARARAHGPGRGNSRTTRSPRSSSAWASVSKALARCCSGRRQRKRRTVELTVAIPSARATKDIGIEQDLVEEIGRIYRYGNIPEQPMQAEIRPPLRDPRRVMVRKIQDRLAGSARFHEVLSYSFLPDDMLARLGEADVPHVSVINPVDKAESRLRRSVLPSLLETSRTTAATGRRAPLRDRQGLPPRGEQRTRRAQGAAPRGPALGAGARRAQGRLRRQRLRDPARRGGRSARHPGPRDSRVVGLREPARLGAPDPLPRGKLEGAGRRGRGLRQPRAGPRPGPRPRRRPHQRHRRRRDLHRPPPRGAGRRLTLPRHPALPGHQGGRRGGDGRRDPGRRAGRGHRALGQGPGGRDRALRRLRRRADRGRAQEPRLPRPPAVGLRRPSPTRTRRSSSRASRRGSRGSARGCASRRGRGAPGGDLGISEPHDLRGSS